MTGSNQNNVGNTVGNTVNAVGDGIKDTAQYVTDSADSAYKSATGQKNSSSIFGSSNKSLTGNSGFSSDARHLGNDMERMADNAKRDLDRKF